MAALVWDPIERPYYAGVDRGVLYLPGRDAVAWNGLVSVVETDKGVGPKQLYLDGRTTRVIPHSEEISFKLSAYTYPKSLDAYLGLDNWVDNQPHIDSPILVTDNGDGTWTATGEDEFIYQLTMTTFEVDSPSATVINTDAFELGSYALGDRFGFSYRVGDEKTGQLHIVYNAKAVVSDIVTRTFSKISAVELFSLDISTTPAVFPGIKPASHFIVELELVPPNVLTQLTNVLYGASTNPPSLPTPIELLDLFEANAIMLLVDHGDGSWTATGPESYVAYTNATTFVISSPSAIPIDSERYTLSSY